MALMGLMYRVVIFGMKLHIPQHTSVTDAGIIQVAMIVILLILAAIFNVLQETDTMPSFQKRSRKRPIKTNSKKIV
ncbi:MAG: hypothetical protein JEY79_09100 [Pseudodesulfovibrio sp.]|jgi:hypothetical protein|nr:hypothetical protein [Pseudodesulfovibrio sp.]